MGVKKLAYLLTSAGILLSSGKLSAQSKIKNKDSPKIYNQIFNENDNFKINFQTRPRLFYIPIGKGIATWKDVPDTLSNKKGRILESKVKITTPFFNLNMHLKTYLDSLGRPTENLYVDENGKKEKLTPLEKKVLEKQFPKEANNAKHFYVNWSNYKKGIVKDGKGKVHPINSSFGDLHNSYFSIIKRIKESKKQNTLLPKTIFLKAFEDTSDYLIKVNLEEGKKYIQANIGINAFYKGKLKEAKNVNKIQIYINKKTYLPEIVKAWFYDVGSAEVKMKDYFLGN